MKLSARAVVAVVGILSAGAAGQLDGAPSGEAFRDGMVAGHWSSAHKQFLGTAYEAYDASGGFSGKSATAPISRVWFTGAAGVLTETFWPSIDEPQVVDSQFIVSAADGGFFEERHDALTTVRWLGRGVPAFQVTNADPLGRFTIEKTVFADPDRDVILQHVRITRNVAGLSFFYLHKPAAGGTTVSNSARVSLGGSDLPTGLYAWQGNEAQAVLFSQPLARVSSGFTGASDGYQDVHSHHAMTYSFETATGGNVTVTAQLNLPAKPGVTDFDVALGFGPNAFTAATVAQASLAAGVSAQLTRYVSQWNSYQNGLLDLGPAAQDGGELYRASLAALKSMEDKTHAGAFVASPTVPWGEFQQDGVSKLTRSRSHQTGGYHLVWPRDLYQMATAFLAAGDARSATAAFNFLKSIQETDASGPAWTYGFRSRGRDGTFPQNAWTDGETGWGGLQLDEVSMPVVLAYRLLHQGAIGLTDCWNLVRRAADFIQAFGPWSPMERWEESYGASPSTIASEIAALRAASAIAAESGDAARAGSYRATADAWASKPGDNVETWTVTHHGDLSSAPYYTRIQGASSFDEVWNPEGDTQIYLANSAGRWPEKDLVDGGFLELVRFAIRPALDAAIRSTLPVYDTAIRIELPGVGPGFRRYYHDRYGYDDATGAQTAGMLWPLLTGERGHYALEAAVESGGDAAAVDAAVNPYIGTMEKMATSEHFLPEQVWDSGPRAGQSTGSATPLGWSHAEYIRLLRSRRDHRVFDREAQAP